MTTNITVSLNFKSKELENTTNWEDKPEKPFQVLHTLIVW